jgi:hypothetical protein
LYTTVLTHSSETDRKIQKPEHFSMGIIMRGSDYKTMDGNLIQQIEENEEEEEEGVPVCGGNLSTPVVDTVNYIGEVHYKIGTRLYIENAD